MKHREQVFRIMDFGIDVYKRQDQENGLVCNAASADEFAKAILSLYD